MDHAVASRSALPAGAKNAILAFMRSVKALGCLVLGFGVAAIGGCAGSDSVDTSGGVLPSGSGGSGGGGDGGGSGSTSSSSTSSSSSSSSSSTGGGGFGGAGGFGGGFGGEGGGGLGGSTSTSTTSTSSTTTTDLCDLGCPAGYFDVDGNPLTGAQCGCEYACTKTGEADPIDADMKDDNCDGGDGLVEQCVYASPSVGSDSTGDGTRANPVASIAQAIDTAKTNGVPAVCLSGEAFSEAVTVVSGISIYGGFDKDDPNFRFRRSNAVETTVTAPGTVFFAPKIDADTHIEGITIIATTPSGAGESTYGVRLGGGVGTLYVRYNDIQAGPGRDGAKGADGAAHVSPTAADGIQGTAGCKTNTSGSCGIGAAAVSSCTVPGGAGGNGGWKNENGADGKVGGNSGGTAGLKGIATAACYSKSSDGGTGGDAIGDGSQGTPGNGGANLGSIASFAYKPSNGVSGSVGLNGKGGGGGGGGGGGSRTVAGFEVCDADIGGGGSSGGCGGLGGALGGGGGGGGGSFGVFASGGKVTVQQNEITTSAGGNGGDGGTGASGQQGGSGKPGSSNSDDSGGGGASGKGTKGGAGGPGGGGGGGPSACLARSPGVTFTFSGSCTTGTPGDKGVGGTNPDGGKATDGAKGIGAANLQIN